LLARLIAAEVAVRDYDTEKENEKGEEMDAVRELGGFEAGQVLSLLALLVRKYKN
jgi:hypothetical protein